MIKNISRIFCVTVCIPLISLSGLALSAQNSHLLPDKASLVQTSISQSGSTAVLLESADSFKNSVEAKAKLRALLANFTSLSAEFSQTITNLQGEVLQSSDGEMHLQKPQKLRWSVQNPEESLLIADGNTVYNVDPFVEQVTMLEQADLTANNPLMLLISNQESQWQSVRVQEHDGSFVLKPSDINAPITRLVLSFDAAGQLSRLLSIDKQEQQNRVEFKNVDTKQPLAASQFSFSVPEGWVVDDQRAL
jgi:outer membrane lipoprotein carrier protein